ncbi:hypothetical protein QF026_008447 [Streptomyces aurantiacus]|nr:hypothetical protein [Streptomyces aurantiacus]
MSGRELTPTGAPNIRIPIRSSTMFVNSGAADRISYERRVIAAASRSALTGRPIVLRSSSASSASM